MISRRWNWLAGFLRPKLPQLASSIADQGLAVGGMFLANVALARAQSKEEYGMFALSYSVFTFISGLHNAALLETYTVYGSGRYQQHGPEYRWLIWRSNAVLGLILTAFLSLVWLALRLMAPALASRSFLGMALTSGILLTGAFMRRMFYVGREPLRAAKLSSVFFVTVALLLWLSIRAGVLNGFTAFVIVAAGWIVGGLFLRQDLPHSLGLHAFREAQPEHWPEHWKYARWVLATAFVFQLASQGYYWLVAGLLSLRQVAELRVLYLLVTPVDQIFVALVLLVLPVMALRYAAGQMAEMLSIWKLYLLLSVLVTASFALLARWFALPLMHAIYGGKFDEVAPLLGTLALLCIVMGVGNAMNAALKAMEKPNMVFYAYLASGATTFLAGIPLVRHYALSGAVYGMLLSASVYAVVMGVGLRYVLQSESKHKKIGRAAATFALAAPWPRSHRTAPAPGGKRVAIVQPVLTDYRLPVFLEMADYCQVDLVFSPSAPESGYIGAVPQEASGVRYFQTATLAPFGARVGMVQWGLAKYILRERPDAILSCCNPRYLSFWTMLAWAKLCGIPIHVHGHGMYKKRRVGWGYRLMTRVMLRMATSYIAYAPVVRDSFAAHGFATDRVRVAENSLVNRCSVRPEEKTGNEHGILFIGRLRPDSKLDLLLRVVGRLRSQDGLPLTLHIIGAGEGDRPLREQAASSWIRWYGEVYDQEQIRAISRNCCLGCYPGNAGLSVVHLMSLSLPVVTHDDMAGHGPEPSFLRDGASGIFFDHTTPEESLYQALKSLVTASAQLASMQHAAFADWEKLSRPSLAGRLWSILDAGPPAASQRLAATPVAGVGADLDPGLTKT